MCNIYLNFAKSNKKKEIIAKFLLKKYQYYFVSKQLYNFLMYITTKTLQTKKIVFILKNNI